MDMDGSGWLLRVGTAPDHILSPRAHEVREVWSLRCAAEGCFGLWVSGVRGFGIVADPKP